MLPDNCQAPKMHILLAVIVLCALICNCHAQTCGREMLSYNFNDRQGPFTNWTKADVWKVWPQGVARKDFRGDEQIPGVIYTKGLHRASIGLGQLRLLMPKDCIGTNECGARFAVRLDEELEEATLSYRFKFGEEYGKGEVQPGENMRGEVYGLIDNWTLGGKLPGLADEDAATACSNSKDVTGTGSFVARTMWRQGGKLMSYMYATPTKEECVNGENWWYEKSIEAEVWYTMYMYIKLNTPEKRDGKHQVWVATDGGEAELVFNRTDVYYRSIQGHGISKLKFDSFHGGSDSRYSPKTDRYVYFDDLKIREGLCIDPGLDLFTQEASQQPILQLSDSFTGSYTREFGQSVVQSVAASGPQDPAARQNSACVPAFGKDHQMSWAQRSAATATDGSELPCGSVSVPMFGLQESDASSAIGRLTTSQWHAVLQLVLVAACTSLMLLVL